MPEHMLRLIENNTAVHSGGFGAVTLTGAGGVAQLLTVAMLFILVLILTYFTTQFVGNYQKNKLTGSNITIIEAQRLSANKLIEIVKVGNKYFVIAVCKDTVTLLGEVDSTELSIKEQKSSINDGFAAILNRVRKKTDEEREDREDR